MNNKHLFSQGALLRKLQTSYPQGNVRVTSGSTPATYVKRLSRTEGCPVDIQGVSAAREFAEQMLNSLKHSLTGRLRDDNSQNKSGSRVAREWLKGAAVFLLIFTLGIGNAWGTDVVVATFESSVVVTSSSYSVYQNDDWYLSKGGNTTSCGFNKDNKTTIGNAHGTSATTTHHGYYIESKNNLANVYKVTFEFTSLGTNGDGKLYLGYSTDNGKTWNAVSLKSGSGLSAQGVAANTANTTYTFEFTAIASARYALVHSANKVLTTASHKFRYDNVTATFYKEQPSGYTVTYSNGGHGTAPSSTTASSVTLAAITGVDGYNCTGWKADVATTVSGSTVNANTLIENGSTVTLSANTTFTAQWSTNNYSITYHENGGTNPGTPATSYTIESSAITLPTPTRTGYTFAGWYANSDLSTGGVQTTIAAGSHENKEYWAKWTVNWKFCYNDDDYTAHTFNSSYQWTQALDGNTTYWFRISDGGSTLYDLGTDGNIMTSSSCTNWEFLKNNNKDCGIRTTAPGNYIFTINDANSATKVLISVTYPTSIAHTLNLNGKGDNITWYSAANSAIPTPANPTASGFAFGGWYTDAGCTDGNEWNFSTVVNSAQTLYAKWTQCYYYYGDNIIGGDWTHHEMTESADGMYWYWQTSSYDGNREFQIQRNGTYYKRDKNSPGFHCTDISDMNSSSNTWNTSYENCAVYYNGGGNYYILVYVPNTSINTTNNPIICASTFLPEASYDMTASRKIYFDNYIVNWSDLHYRIGHKCHTSANAMTLVPGTAGLYQVTTAAYGGYNAFHVANNAAWNGNYDIYAVRPGSYDISNCLMFQKYAIDGDITLTPGSINNTESGCSYWTVTKTSGMKSRNVAITAPSHGTITVTYTNTSGATGQTLTSGNADLAYTCNLTISTEGASGYEFSSMTKNGAAYTPGALVLTEDITLAATFSPISYSITYHENGGTITPTPASSYTIESSAITLPTPTRAGWHFDGWYANSDLSTGGVQTTIAAGSTGDKEYWAAWTKETYNVTLDKGTGGSGDGSATVQYGDATLSNLSHATKDNYHLTGYYTAASEGTKVLNDDGTFAGTDVAGYITSSTWSGTSDVTLYAQWEINSYTVTWAVEGSAEGVTQGSTSATHGSKVAAVPASNPSVPAGCSAGGAIFLGWTTHDDSEGGWNSSALPADIFTTAANSPAITGPTTFNAVFGIKSGSLTYTRTAAGSVTQGIYVIAAYDKDENVLKYFAATGGIDGGKMVNEATGFTIDANNQFTTLPTDACEFTFAGDNSDGFSIANANSEKLTYTEWNNNKLGFASNATTLWTVITETDATYPSDGVAFQEVDNSSDLYKVSKNAATGSTTFIRGYKNTVYDPIYLFKRSGSLSYSNVATTCGATYDITFKEGNDSPTGDPSGTSNGAGKIAENATTMSITTSPTAPTGYEVEGYYKEAALITKVATSAGALQNGSGSGIAGWTNSSGQFIGTADADLYIKWQAKTITVTWDVNGGTALDPGTSSYTYNGSTVVLPTPTKAGYWFDGWYTLAEGGAQITEIGTTNKPTSNVTYYAHWTSKTYTDYLTECVDEYDITLHDNNGGSHNGSAKVTSIGTALTTIVAPTRTGYEVDYYKTAADGVKVAEADGSLVASVPSWTNATPNYIVGADATMYAHWKYATYAIAYYDKDGEEFSGVHGTDHPTTHTYNTATLLVDPTKAGYTFGGWYTASDCSSGLVTSLGATAYTSGPINLYAKWTQNNWTLTMASSVGGGAGTTTTDGAITAPTTGAGTVTNKHYGDVITITIDAVPAHHSFTGWTRSDGVAVTNPKNLSTTITMPDADLTVTANFTEETKYTVTWYDNGDGSNTTQVYTGTTSLDFPALAVDCELYAAAGWIAVDNPATDFVAETMDKPAATIYAASTSGVTVPAITANRTYKAVYRHKYFTTSDFVNGTTDGEAYYLYATYGEDNYYKTVRAYSGSTYGFTTSTTKSDAVPVYLIKAGDYYYMRDVNTGKYYYSTVSSNNYNISETDSYENADAYKWSFAAASCNPLRGEFHITNKAHAANTTLLFNSSTGHNIKDFKQTGACPDASYYDLNLEKAYYYKYSPTAACYTIDYTPKGGTVFETTLVGNVLTTKVACGKRLSSWSFNPEGSATLASGSEPEYIGMEGDKSVYRFVIIPTANTTLQLNSGNGETRTISFLDGSSEISQTKTTAITNKRDCESYNLPNGYNSASGAGGTCTDWTFDGWTKTEYTFGQLVTPSDIVAAGTSQDVHRDATWYAVYHKTFAADDYFYLKFGDNYVTSYSTTNSNYFTAGSTSSTGALMFALEDGYLYFLEPSTRAKMWVYANGNSLDPTITTTKPTSTSFKTTMTLVGSTYQITNGNNRYLSANGETVKYYSGTTYTHATKPNAGAFTAYYPKTDCAIETVTITFNPGAGNTCALSSITAEQGSTISLPVAADVSGYDADWTFSGWTTTEITDIATAAPNPLYAGGSTYTATATATLYAVYSQVPPDGNFENTAGGKYKIWAVKNGIYYYATSNGQQKGKLGVTTDCSEGALFELTRNDVTGGYKIHINGETKYLKGGGLGDTDFDYVQYASAPEWTITDVHSTSPNGYWRILSGIENRAIVFGHTNFGHYDATQIANSPTMWYDVYIGQCSDDYYTSNPNKTLSLSGDIKITSTNGETVRAHSSITVHGSLLTGSSITVTSSNAKFTAVPASTTITDGVINTTIAIDYTPTSYNATDERSTITVAASDKIQRIEVYGRSLPQNFVIAAKMGGKWYALPNTCTASGTQPGLAIEVDDDDAPTAASLAPHDVEFGLSDVVNTRWPDYKDRVWLFEQKTGNKQALKDNANANIQVNAQVNNISAGNSAEYEWLPETSDFQAYTLTNTSSSKKLSIKTDGTFGTHSQLVASSEIYLLPITAYYTLVDASVMEWGTDHLVVSMATPPATATKLKIKVGETLGSEQALASTKKDEGIYLLTASLSSSDALKELKLIFYNSSDVEVGRTILSVPMLVSTTDATTDGFSDGVKAGSATCDIIVLNGAKLTVSEESAAKMSFRDLYIYGGGKMVVPADKGISVSHVIMRGGHLNSSWQYQYSHPQLVLNGYMSTSVGKIYYDYLTDNSQFYSLSLPYNVTLTDIVNPYFNNKRSWLIHGYDGALRASGSQVSGWYDVETGSQISGETSIAPVDHLTAGVGYTFFGAPQKVNSIRQKWSVNRFRMTVSGNPEAEKAGVTVTAHGMTETPAESGTYVLNENVTPNNACWNMLGNPYLADIGGTAAFETGVSGIILSSHNEKVLDANDKWTGAWKWITNETNVRYVRIPNDQGTEYSQVRFKDATLKAFHHFFIQASANGTFSFSLGMRAQSAPGLRRSNDKILPEEMDIDFILSNEEMQTNFGLTINDEFVEAFVVNEDMPEDLDGSATKAYTLAGTTRLTYNGLPVAAAEQFIPVGYRADAAGEYTFEYKEDGNADYIEHIWLTDFGNGKATDLKVEEYSFETESGTFDERFALNVVFRKNNSATDMDEVDESIDKPLKFFYQQKMFILREGVIYDATGKRVKEINK